ncbi:MAG: hypothetical protein HQM13_13575 [SAR324 cluster bacterium]|nr:hypothetical protein [SAR324 cluster bacterium]
MKISNRNKLFGASVFILLFFVFSCGGNDEPCSDVNLFCSREANARLKVDDKSVAPGDQVLLEASDSTYDDITWTVNGVEITECKGQEVCSQTWTENGDYEVAIKVKVNATGGGAVGLITQGANNKEATSDKTSVTVSVADANSSDSSGASDGSDASSETTTTTSTTTTTLASKRIFVSNATGKGNAVSTIDCTNDANNPNGGTYSLLLSAGIIQANIIYLRSDGTTEIGTSDGNGNLTVTNSIGSGIVWTGMTAAQTASANNCSNWTNGAGGTSGTTGDPSQTGSTAFSTATASCNGSYAVYCVEQ